MNNGHHQSTSRYVSAAFTRTLAFVNDTQGVSDEVFARNDSVAAGNLTAQIVEDLLCAYAARLVMKPTACILKLDHLWRTMRRNHLNIRLPDQSQKAILSSFNRHLHGQQKNDARPLIYGLLVTAGNPAICPRATNAEINEIAPKLRGQHPFVSHYRKKIFVHG